MSVSYENQSSCANFENSNQDHGMLIQWLGAEGVIFALNLIPNYTNHAQITGALVAVAAGVRP